MDKKIWYLLQPRNIHTMESTFKKNEILPFAATWMDLEGICLRSKPDRERQILHDITYMWNLRNYANKYICKAEKDSQI